MLTRSSGSVPSCPQSLQEPPQQHKHHWSSTQQLLGLLAGCQTLTRRMKTTLSRKVCTPAASAMYVRTAFI